MFRHLTTRTEYDRVRDMDITDDDLLELIDDLWAGYNFECTCSGSKGFTCGDCLLKERVEELIRV